ncbi:MAG: hypothetical protein HOK88_01750 [Candidatus Marinimicrobia bacterium]|nr:hypothetical protein [Candidatus Neomarinimicrobiota bacterium]
MIKTLLLRRYWLLRHRFLSTIFFITLFPIIFHFTITKVMENILPLPFNNIAYEVWVFPAVIFLIASTSTFAIIYRDFFDLRIHKISFLSITIAPFKKTHLIVGFIITSIIESFFYVIITMITLKIIMVSPLHWTVFLFTPIFTFIYTFLLANIIVTFSIISDRIFTFLSFSIILFFFIIFGNGFIIEFDLFPHNMGRILSFNPLSIILSELRNILFFNNFDWKLISIPILVALFWTLLNGNLLKRKLKQ